MRQIPYAEEFPVTFMLPSWRKPIPGMGSTEWLPLEEQSMERGKNSDLTVKKYDKYALSQMIKVKINSVKSC